MRWRGDVLRQVQTLFEFGTLAGLTDGELLERFAALWEMENSSDPVSIVSLFAPSTQGISTDLLISINSLKLGGK